MSQVNTKECGWASEDSGQALGSMGGLASQQTDAGKCEQIRKGSGQAMESVSRPARTVHGYWKAWMVKVGVLQNMRSLGSHTL